MDFSATCLEESLQFIDQSLAVADFNFINAYTEFMELTEEVDDRVFTEKHQATIGETLRIFLASVVNLVQKLRDTIKTEMEQRIFSANFKKRIEELKIAASDAENSGANHITMPNIHKVAATYEEMVDALCKKADRISDVRYLTPQGLDNDIKDFNEIADYYDKKLGMALEETVDMPIKEAIAFAEQEANGGELLQSLDKAMRQFKKMESNVKQIETKEAIVGKDLITKKVVIIRRTTNSLVKSIRKWVGRIVARCVFFFA